MCLLAGSLVPVLCLEPMEYPVYRLLPGDGSARNNFQMKPEVLAQVSIKPQPLETENCCSFVESLLTDYPLFKETFYNISQYIEIVLIPAEVSSESTSLATLPNNMNFFPFFCIKQ